MIVKLLTEHHLEFLSLRAGCIYAHPSLHLSKSQNVEISCRGSFVFGRAYRGSTLLSLALTICES